MMKEAIITKQYYVVNLSKKKTIIYFINQNN